MLTSIISEATASGEEIHNLVAAIEPVLVGSSKGSAMIACLSIVLSLQNPNLSPEDRVEGVQKVSEYICLWLDEKAYPAIAGRAN